MNNAPAASAGDVGDCPGPYPCQELADVQGGDSVGIFWPVLLAGELEKRCEELTVVFVRALCPAFGLHGEEDAFDEIGQKDVIFFFHLTCGG